ncbi:monovalent cation:proton antiporter [Bacillus mesophilus]|uniref:Na(+)/H(+) antiporter subunit B n=1 Tax=Bacillus mesophilus TaxID=1808955 RepID=A0A6M0Q1K0_9BACI|nr:Na(+)/H(+) antiporter subunit B [Bacillus mesophilus]MBM7659253.1 monovalent cation:proton antiporter [Bacillus mesophilus]NEY70127.1 Na(+)/H(+) antiporter subunit B [Bacillus mesophilus]
MRTNDLILKTTTNIIVFIILAFSFKLFLAGHNMPGGGFIGGLMTAGAIILMYLTYGLGPIKKVIRVPFTFLIALGLAIAVATGLGSFIFEQPFLSQTDGYFYLPILGKTHLATAVLFDIGVYLTVIGVTMTIILSIAEDQ